MRVWSLSLFALALVAEDTPSPDLIVTADRAEADAWRSTASTTVLREADVADGRTAVWTDRLRNQAGVDLIAVGGGFDGGGISSLRLRGAARDIHTRVLVDGVPLTDPSTTEGQPYLGGQTIPGLERIEVVRGSQSGLYGSSAMAGVVNLISADPGEVATASARVAGGSFGTLAGEAEASGPMVVGADHRLGFQVAASGYRSDSVSATVTTIDEDPDAREADAAWATGFNGRLVWSDDVGSRFYAATLIGAALHDYDYADPDDDTAWNRNDRVRIGAGGAVPIGDAGARASVDLAITDIRRQAEYFDVWAFPAAPSTNVYDSSVVFGAARLITPVAHGATLGFGVDAERQAVTTTAVPDGEQDLVGGYGDLRWSQPSFETTLAARYDHVSSGDGATTWKLGGAWFGDDGTWKVHASAGTGFRAPSLDERFGQYPGFFPFSGNPDLESETSLSADLGVAVQGLAGVSADVTLFQTTYEHRIRTNATFDSLINEDGESSVIGIEVAAVWRSEGWWMVEAACTWQETEDAAGQAFINIPEHKGFLSGGADAGSWFANLRLDGVGERLGYGTTNLMLPGYGLVGVAAGLRPLPWLTVDARVDNLFDKRYATATSFGTAYFTGMPRTFLVGMEATY